MIEQKLVGEVVQLCFNLALVWVLYFQFVKPMRTARLRQRLFELRDELFRMGAVGYVSYDQAPYLALERSINLAIRYAEEISLARLLFVRLAFPGLAAKAAQTRLDWEIQTAPLHRTTREMLNSLRDRVSAEVASYVLFSPALIVLGPVAIARSLWRSGHILGRYSLKRRSDRDEIYAKFVVKSVQGLDRLEAHAVETEEAQRRLEADQLTMA